MAKNLLNQDYKMSKVAILSINDRVALHQKTARSIDCVWLARYLEQVKGLTVDFIGHKIMETVDVENYIDYKDMDLSQYDELYIINSMIHFIGGDIKHQTMPIIKALLKYDKQINVLFTDPKLWFINFPQKIFNGSNLKYKDELRITKEDIEGWKNLKLKALWPGKDYLRYIEGKDRKYYQRIEDFELFPLFEFTFKHKKFPPRNNNYEEKLFDICYWGDKRQGDRKKKVDKYFANNLHKLLIGWLVDDESGNVVCHKKLPHKTTMEKITESKSALVVGDDDHDNNITTFRFYESIKMGLITFIDRAFDPNMELIKHPVLRQLLYVDNAEQIEKRINQINEELFHKIIALQDKEIDL